MLYRGTNMALQRIVLGIMLILAVEAQVAKCDTIYRVACGASTNMTDGQGFVWTGDGGSNNLGNGYLNLNSGKDIMANTSAQDVNVPDSVPYYSGRIFTSPASYSFPVNPGRHWVRLYFYPFSYNSFNKTDAIVTVKTESYELMTNVSLNDVLNSLNLGYLIKEFSVNVTGNFLTLNILPGSVSNSFALINGIVVEPMPSLFISDLNTVGLANSIPYPLQGTTLETKFRLNVGGQAIQPSSDLLGRTWDTDTEYLIAAVAGVASSVPNANISYGQLSNSTAPVNVYNSARFMTTDSMVNLQVNLTWNFSVDVNFTYYIRMHFCELEYAKQNMRVFDIYINNQVAYSGYDVISAAGGQDVATILDFALLLAPSDSSIINIQLHPNNSTGSSYYNAILNGLEIYKMNDTTGNLQGPPPPLVSAQLADAMKGESSMSSTKKFSIIGGVVGSVAAICALAIMYLCLRQKKKGKAGHPSPAWFPLSAQGGNSQSMVSKLSTTSRKSGTGSYVSSAPSNNCRYFSFTEIQDMTDNFDEAFVVGVGGFGKVYKGVLEDGTTVAVKRGNPTSEQGMTEFQTEIELLSKLRHRHLVSLIGFCEDQSEMILVYDYMSNGPLRGHLYGAGNPPLSWKQRLEICIGAARGLHYLHTGAAHGIIHRDVKTTNILLDENFVAKVSDFGLSKTGPSLDHTHVSTAVKGSFGYLDPEYFRRQQLTEKSDVYSFGVVLLEVLCARPAINPTLPREQVNMAEWAMHNMKKGTLDDIIDPYLKGKINRESLKKFADTAEKCLAESGLDRPTMGTILWNLEYALQLHESSPERDLDISNPKVKEIPLKVDSEVELPEIDGKKLENSHSSVIYSEESDEAARSAVFSQLMNPQGR